MKGQTLEVKAALQIQKSAHEVFEAIVDPAKMSHYFISKSTGRMEAGKQLVWKFPEFDMEFPIHVSKVVEDRYIAYHWTVEGRTLLVEISLTQNESSTVVSITEGKMECDEAGIKWLGGNSEGWANFLACLKAYLEYGINLRKGAFDFRKGLAP